MEWQWSLKFQAGDPIYSNRKSMHRLRVRRLTTLIHAFIQLPASFLVAPLLLHHPYTFSASWQLPSSCIIRTRSQLPGSSPPPASSAGKPQVQDHGSCNAGTRGREVRRQAGRSSGRSRVICRSSEAAVGRRHTACHCCSVHGGGLHLHAAPPITRRVDIPLVADPCGPIPL